MSTMLHVLQHALGRDEYGRMKPGRTEDYRNHFCAGGEDIEVCRSAVRAGLMVEHAASTMTGGDPVFVATTAGKRFVTDKSPAPPKISRGRATYQAWLSSASADIGVTFGQWLRAAGHKRLGTE